jgi:hypothetical protein
MGSPSPQPLTISAKFRIILIAIIQILGSLEKDHMPCQQDPSILTVYIGIFRVSWKSKLGFVTPTGVNVAANI